MGKNNIEILPIIRDRKSCRRYDLSKEISEDNLLSILEAGRLSPSGKNFQSWTFLIIKNQETKNKIVDFVDNVERKFYLFLKKAPILVAILEEPSSSSSDKDCGITGYSMQLEAWSRGIGSCMSAFHRIVSEETENAIKKLLRIPKNLHVNIIIGFGFPATEGAFMNTNRRPLEKIVCTEKFTKPLMTMKIFKKKLNRRTEEKRSEFKPDNIACPNCKIPNALVWTNYLKANNPKLYCGVCNVYY